jgi:hypothetical protein
MRRRWLLLGVGALAFLGAILMLHLRLAPPSGVTRENCKKIKTGMAPEEVIAILGRAPCSAQELTSLCQADARLEDALVAAEVTIPRYVARHVFLVASPFHTETWIGDEVILMVQFVDGSNLDPADPLTSMLFGNGPARVHRVVVANRPTPPRILDHLRQWLGW